MLYAVTIDPLNAIFFLGERPEESAWHVQEGVELDLPFNYDTWPDGEKPPEQVLCTSLSEPSHYRMFKYKRDVDLSEYRPTLKHFGGIYSKSTWLRFMKNLPAALAVQGVPDQEPPGATEEAVKLIKQRA
jgi:hypothetical protein